jgi:hypothetical protein
VTQLGLDQRDRTAELVEFFPAEHVRMEMNLIVPADICGRSMCRSQHPESVVPMAEVEIEFESTTTAECELDVELAIVMGSFCRRSLKTDPVWLPES